MPDKLSRKQFLQTSVGAAIATVVAGKLPLSATELTIAQAQGAEKIFRGGPILTMDDNQQQVEAVAIAGGRIIAAGTAADVMATATAATEIVELNGNTLMPSFIDAHGHFMNAPQIVQWANVSGPPVGPVKTIPDIITALQEHVEKLNIQPGEWIIGYGYDITSLSEGRELSRNDLDPHFPDHPVLLIHVSNHGCVLNSQGFAKVGIDASTPTPPGGLILRQEGSNEPAGLLMETAFLPVFANLPQPTEEELLDTLDAAQQIYASAGVTTCQEGATHAKDLKFLLKAAEQERFYLDIYALPLVLEVPALVREYFPDFSNPDTELPDTASTSFGTYKNRLKSRE
jgi:predicted amidohydrolase YtcJ